MPASRAMACAVRSWSPVSMAVRTPISFRRRIAWAASGRMRSRSAITPAAPSSSWMTVTVLPSCCSRSMMSPSSGVRFAASIYVGLPIFQSLPSSSACTPQPVRDSNDDGRVRVIPSSVAFRTIALASGCSERVSTDAATRSTSLASKPRRGTTSDTSGCPVVSVPVLSKATTLVRARFSRWTPPLNSTPLLALTEMADSTAGMMDATSAHGEATTRNTIALYSASCQVQPNSSGGAAMRSSVASTTTRA